MSLILDHAETLAAGTVYLAVAAWLIATLWNDLRSRPWLVENNRKTGD